MEREIKFRVWDGKQLFYDWGNVSSIGNAFYRFYCPEIEITKMGRGYDLPKLSNFEEKYIFMQYTGLKDAINKNEVYGHDIINLLGVGFLKVEWDYRHTGWICLDKHYKKRNLADVLLNGGIRVGNIYENPDLFKG